MTKLPKADNTRERIFAAIKAKGDERHSQRIGASWIGGDCDRAIWYKFRWAKLSGFDGRMLRLFRTGKFAEEEIAKDLRNTGATVLDADPETGEQFFFEDLGGHMCGFMDGAGCGFIEAPATWHVIEYKTHNDKSFADLEKNGLEKSKPQHFAQLQIYMGWSGMERALYVALNKNTDDIYIERVKFNKGDFKALRQRAKEIIFAIDPPDRMSDSPAFWRCKMCEFSGICHQTGELAERNCRTCKHCQADEEGGWSCSLHRKILTKDEQEAACADHRYMAGMLPEVAERTAKTFGGKVVQA
jgi:CRISPR/Cas system-associated exonuclease Cas4 (RecB family)